MKKIVKITESELEKIVNLVLSEQGNVRNMKLSNDLRTLPDKQKFNQCTVTRKGEFVEIFIHQIDTVYRIKIS